MANRNPAPEAPVVTNFPPPGRTGAERGFRVALGGVLAAGLLLFLGAPLPEHRALGAAGYLLGGAAWAAAVVLAPRVRSRPSLGWTVALCALALRLFALAAEPGLSDDLNRYVWEGRLVAEGTSPYAAAPADPARAAERARWPELYGRLNHPEVSAAYPPLAQWLLAGLVVWAPDPGSDGGAGARRVLRVGFAVVDLCVFALLALWLRRTDRPPLCAVAWGLSPLLAFEFAGAGHFDVLAVLPVACALAALAKGSERGRTIAVAALAIAAGIKLVPVVALPFALRGSRHPLRLAALALVVLGLSLVPLLGLEGGLGGLGAGLSEYALRWESFNLLSRWVERPLEGLFERDGSFTDPRRLTRALLALLGLWIFVRAWRRSADPARAMEAVFGGVLVLTPTLHPWYLALVVPFLARWPRAPWLWLVAAVPLSYWPLTRWRAEGVWDEPAWSWFAVALPFWGLFVRERWRARAAGTSVE